MGNLGSLEIDATKCPGKINNNNDIKTLLKDRLYSFSGHCTASKMSVPMTNYMGNAKY